MVGQMMVGQMMVGLVIVRPIVANYRVVELCTNWLYLILSLNESSCLDYQYSTKRIERCLKLLKSC